MTDKIERAAFKAWQDVGEAESGLLMAYKYGSAEELRRAATALEKTAAKIFAALPPLDDEIGAACDAAGAMEAQE